MTTKSSSETTISSEDLRWLATVVMGWTEGDVAYLDAAPGSARKRGEIDGNKLLHH